MKHLLSGVALAAVLAIAAPVWAQSPMSPSTPTAPPSAAPNDAATPAMEPARPRRHAQRTHAQPRSRTHTRSTHRGRRPYYGWGRPGDHVANQLNAQELGRVGGGWSGGAFPPHDSPN